MKNYLKLIAALILIDISSATAGLPPTTSKVSSDSSNATTFNYQFPNFTGTHTGPTLSLGVNSIAGGGTGQATANAALNALLPTQTGNSGSVLETNGTNALWTSVGASAMPSAIASSTSVVTSASTSFVTAITTSITTTAASAPIYASAVATLTTTTAASVANVQVVINGVAGQTQLVSLAATATNYMAKAEYTSAAVAPGTYTVTFQIARSSGSGTVSFFEGTLSAIGLQGGNTGGITQLTGALQAGPGSGSQALSGILPLANGGSGANLTAGNGSIPYSTASVEAFLAHGTSGQLLQTLGLAAPAWTTETFPTSTTINQILYSSAANVVSGLATANEGALVTSSTGVPSITSGSTANRLLRTNGTTVSFAQANLTSDVTGTLPATNGGTGLTSFSSGAIPFGTGTNLNTNVNVLNWDNTNSRLSVGGVGGTAMGNFVQEAGATHATLNSYQYGSNNNVQIVTQNNNYDISLTKYSASPTLGVLLGAQFGRGTIASPAQSLNGDLDMTIVASGTTNAGATPPGFSGAIGFTQTEDCTATANGGDITLGATPNGTLTPIERVRVKHSGETQLTNSHFKSIQTTPPVATVNGNAGTGSSCTVADATDNAGQITITTGTVGVSTGDYCDLAFNAAYGVAPICVFTPANSTISTSVYATSTTSTLSFNFAIAGGISSTYVMNYHCMETQ